MALYRQFGIYIMSKRNIRERKGKKKFWKQLGLLGFKSKVGWSCPKMPSLPYSRIRTSNPTPFSPLSLFSTTFRIDKDKQGVCVRQRDDLWKRVRKTNSLGKWTNLIALHCDHRMQIGIQHSTYRDRKNRGKLGWVVRNDISLIMQLHGFTVSFISRGVSGYQAAHSNSPYCYEHCQSALNINTCVSFNG